MVFKIKAVSVLSADKMRIMYLITREHMPHISKTKVSFVDDDK